MMPSPCPRSPSRDTDGTLDPATVRIVSDPAHGSASASPVSGTVTYSPNAGYTGTDSFTYTVDDDDGAISDVATVTVTVEDASDNEPPVAVDDLFSTSVDTPMDVDVLANDFDPDGDALTVSDHDVDSAEGGVVSCASGGVCTYSPPAGFMGTDSFEYVASDGHGGTDAATVMVEISESGPASLSNFVYLPLILNAAPVAVDDWVITEEDIPVDVNVLANDIDPDGDILVLIDHDVASAEGGAVSCTVLGVCTYSPPAGFTGTDTFDYTAGDGGGGTGVATVTVEVVESVSAPVYKLYVPVVYNLLLPTTSMPDLVVARLVATTNSVQITIRNQSDEPFFSDESCLSYYPVYSFRVDLYVVPDPVPTGANQVWNDGRSAQGAVWYVPTMAVSAQAGDEVTLTIGDEYYRPILSNFPGSLPVGTPVYAQVDSANPGTAYGVVLESHEVAGGDYNNVTGPVLSTSDVGTGRED
jgi:hypothetical protein